MKRLLIYSDTSIFGGHEMMLMRHIENSLLDWSGEIHLLYNPANNGIDDLLRKINAGRNRIFSMPVLFASKTFQQLRDPQLQQKINSLARLMQTIDPDLVLVVQGNIELCSLGLLAAARAGRKLTSYIPLGHGFREMGRRMGWLRDMVNRRLYALPDKFITICESQKKLLITRGVPAEKIDIVPNFVELSPGLPKNQSLSRSILGLPGNVFLFGVIGRIQFCHKGQDFLLRAFAANMPRLPGCALVVVGSGPDEQNLLRLTERLGIGKHVFLLPWQEDVAPLYAALDALVIPSRLEGNPLVMLEAVQFGLPVLASRIDGMAENLPSQWLFGPANAKQMIERLCFVFSEDQQQLVDATRASFRNKFSRLQARKQFREALGIPNSEASGQNEEHSACP